MTSIRGCVQTGRIRYTYHADLRRSQRRISPLETKKKKLYIEHAYGFPVYLLNVPMVKLRGVWTPDIDYNELEKTLICALASKTSRVTGSEVAFIRKYFGMNARAFANRFAVSHVAVLKWESCASRPTKMSWSTEKDIRLFIVNQVLKSAKILNDLYVKLETITEEKPSRIRLELKNHDYRLAA